MRNLLFLLSFIISSTTFAGDPISCGPEPVKAKALFASVSSVRDGDWYNGATWSTGRVPAEIDQITVSHNLTSTKNIVIRGVLTGVKGKITFTGIDERNFSQLGGMNVVESDIGLWVMGSGQLQLIGEKKRSWTTLQGSAVRGATSISVTNADNWKVGDVIVVVPTEKPTNNIDWNDARNEPIDPMIGKFERRTITAINGTNISFAVALQHDHLSVTSTVAQKTWTAEVENLTRSFIIEGTATGRAHIYIRSDKPQTIKYVEGRFLGPRTPGRRSGDLVTGRYGLHFHHCMNGSFGSVVEGNAFHDLGNRVYVPHVSNGITFTENVAHSMSEQPFWWDFQDQSHYITLDRNIASLRVYNGVNSGSVTGIELGQGDNNTITNSVAVYLHHGDQHQQGAYAWNTDNVGVWIFKNNIAHSNTTGLFVWQNDNANHVIENYEAYNNILGMHHGAYLNEYNYIGGILYNSILSVEATQASTTPMFTRMVVDGGGKLQYLVRILSSPVTAGQPNQWVNCTFEGFTVAAFEMKTELFAEAVGRKIAEIISPTSSSPNLTSFAPTSIYNSFFRVQPKSGQSYQVTQSGRSNINPFALTTHGTGSGLYGKYFNGANFNSFAFERIEPVKFQQWSVDKGASPNGVHHRITPGGAYSVIWTGFYEAQVSGQTQFAASSYGGIRVTVNDRLLIDRWAESQESNKIDGSMIALEAGKRYKIKVEHFDAGGQRGVSLFTKRDGQYNNVPIYQLYPEAAPIDTVIIRNRPPVVNAGSDVITTDSIIKIEGSASDPDNNLKSVVWSGTGVILQQNQSDAAHVMVKGKAGVYKLRIVGTDQAGLTAADEMMLEIRVKVDTSGPVNPCSIFDGAFYLKKYPDVAQNWRGTPLSHYEQYGKNEGRIINAACEGSFKNKVQTASTVCLNGQTISFTVPAGKYSGATQNLADALAIQELNAELAKCPQPWFTVDLPEGKGKLYIFGVTPPYQYIIK